MIITQDDLINEISKKEDIDVATVRKIFKSAENIIFAYLSSTPPIENIVIRIFKGLSLKRKYIEKKRYSKGLFEDIDSPEHVNISGNITKYYISKVNDKLFS